MKMKNLLSIFTSSLLTQTRIKFISSRDVSALAVKIRQFNPLCTLCPSSMQRMRVLSKYGQWLSTISQISALAYQCALSIRIRQITVALPLF